ncbi:hypothetical protein [Bacillus pseudomycoides]|uniref:hypothetical protein n=1 Tax=Bacillus pseudomycoides TaxID=64104 RepID=UPI001FB32340|nr:hypothetical protein [Bacillus pseudomycoides]
MKKNKESKAYAIGDDRFYEVVISNHKDIAVLWFRDTAGYSTEEMDQFSVWEFPLDKKVFIRDYGEISARELIQEVIQSEVFRGVPIVAFEKKIENDYFENWHSYFKIEKPTD